MQSNKVLAISDCWFNLPDDFDGGLEDALNLLAKHLLDSTRNYKVYQDNIKDRYQHLMDGESIKVTMLSSICEWSDEDNEWKYRC